MQGLPTQQLPKSAHGSAKGIAADSSKAAHAKGESQVENANGEFASLFAGMAGKAEGKASQVETQPGEILKNLLAEKNKGEAKEGEGKIVVDPKLMQAGETKQAHNNVINLKGDSKIEKQIAKSSSNLDQLLNNLKGTQDYEPVEGSEDEGAAHSLSQKNTVPSKTESKNESPLDFLMKGAKEKGVKENSSTETSEEGATHSLSQKNTVPSKTESKNESPLDFLMKGAKAKGVTENSSTDTSKTETEHAQKKVMTGDDFLKNMQAADKKPALAIINGQKGEELIPAKLMNQNTKAYGQGMNLMNDSVIRNTKDLANKDVKKGKQDLLGVDELRTKDTKAGAELASIRQEAVPGVQNNKDNHGQSQLQTSSNQKVLDLSHLNTSNTTEIIKKISDYVEQNNVTNKQSLDLTVKHESLGEFKIQVSKLPESMNGGLNQIDMQITTSSKEGHDFFVKNEVSLMKNLNQAGINLSDLRIVSSSSESSAFGQTDSRQASSFSQGHDGSKQFSSFESSNFSSDNGSQRRKELWDEYQQRYGA